MEPQITETNGARPATATHHHQQSTGSLGGFSAASLDGESLEFPDLSDIDDMSSLCVLSHQGRPAVEPSVPGEGATEISSTPRSPENRSAGLYVDTAFDESTFDQTATVANEEHPNDVNNSEGSKGKRGGFIPSWILGASPAIKATILFSIVLLVGSILLVAIAVSQRGGSSGGEGDNQTDAATTSGQNSPVRDSPTDPPTGRPTTLPTAVTDAPTQPLIPPPTMQPQSPPPTVKPFSTPTDSTPPPSNSALDPTQSPTKLPTLSPTTLPIPSPTTLPIPLPTTLPIPSPTTLPIPSPTLLPTSSQPSSEIVKTAFFVIGGSYDLTFLAEKLPTLPTTKGDFLVHLGDWNANPLNCNEEVYFSFAGGLNASSVPVYTVPGDNEYNDCLDPTQAWAYWKQYFNFYDVTYWPESAKYVVTRSFGRGRTENFAFAYRNVLYIGINLVGGFVHDVDEWDERIEDDLAWIRGRVLKYQDEVEVTVIFQHASPEESAVSDYTDKLYYDLVPNQIPMPLLIVHMNLGDVPKFNLVQEPRGVAGVKVLEVVGGSWPPVRVEIDTELNIMEFDQGWYDPHVKVSRGNGER